MIKNKLVNLALVSCMALLACFSTGASAKGRHATKRAFTITCDIKGMPPSTILLEMLRANDSLKIVDSVKSDANGHFAFKGTQPEPGLYRLQLNKEKFILLSLDQGNAKLTSTWPITDYNIEGSEPSVQLKHFVDTVVAYMNLINQTSHRIDSVKMLGNADEGKKEEEARSGIALQMREVVKRYSESTAYEPNSIISTRVLNPTEDLKFYESFDHLLDKKFPGTIMTKEFHQFMVKMKETLPAPTEIGDKAPDLTLLDTNGREVKLSSFRGKYVLLDFWASWCGPCRAENPNVRAAFEQFKKKNFTIMSVSLDNSKDRWLQAVDHDKLDWTQVSDLKGWSSPAAAKYGVHAIPTNFLIDPSGIIIAKSLRGPMLEDKLGTVLQ